MAATSRRETATVSCPHCDRETVLSVPNPDAELEVRRSVALFGDYTTTECPVGHEFWVYSC